jgi:serine/threonine protein kinase
LIPCRGYTPPEYVDKQEISPKFDVFSLGVVIIHIMAGRKHYYDHVDNPSKIIEIVSKKFLSHESLSFIKLRCVFFMRWTYATCQHFAFIFVGI